MTGTCIIHNADKNEAFFSRSNEQAHSKELFGQKSDLNDLIAGVVQGFKSKARDSFTSPKTKLFAAGLVAPITPGAEPAATSMYLR